jgi:hypothetical protein
MKFILIFSVLSAIFSCSAVKETPVNPEKVVNVIEDKVDELNEPEMIVGKVRVSKEATGCQIFIEAFRNGEMFLLYPINLTEKYKVDGIKIKFSFTESKAPLPENCPAAIVGVLENISRLN